MLIRREDKELIHNLAILGAVFGACICVFLTVHLSNQAYEQDKEHNEYQETNAALAKLSSSAAEPETAIVDQDILQQVQEHIQLEQPESVQSTKKSFWVGLPQWGFWGICAGSCVVGLVTGFSTILGIGWLSSILIYSFIRLFYRIIRKVAPNSAAAQLTQHNQTAQSNQFTFQRDEERILPTLVKLTFLLLLALSTLAVVIWKITGI